MPQTYKFTIDCPVTDTLPRNRVSNTFHLEHSIGALVDTDLDDMCADIIGMYQARYNNITAEFRCKAYDVGAPPNYPRSVVTVHAGIAHTAPIVREVAMVLSFAGDNRGNKRERGRIYLAPYLSFKTADTYADRPSAAVQNWALQWFSEPNASLPDLGGVDWKFGVYSGVAGKFTQAQQAWVNDEWDTQRRRGLRETSRVTSVREG